MDKHALIRALCEQLEGDIARAIETAERTRAGATHEEAKPENDKDTRALEQSYLARGQAQRVVDLQEELRVIKFMPVREFGQADAIEISALVQVESDDQTRWLFLTEAAGGRSVQLEAATIDVVTPQAPLGRSIVGRSVDEEFTLRIAGKAREFIVTKIE